VGRGEVSDNSVQRLLHIQSKTGPRVGSLPVCEGARSLRSARLDRPRHAGRKPRKAQRGRGTHDIIGVRLVCACRTVH